MKDPCPRARVGTSGWNKPHWRGPGRFYVPGVPQAHELDYAAERMATLEINTTFYGFRPSSSFLGWRASVPEDFVFSVKGPRVITHDLRLVGATHSLAEFLASGVLLLQEKLGPMLWQLPPDLGFRPDAVDAFLATLPHSVDEARHLIARCGLPVDPALEALADGPIRQGLEVRNGGFRDLRFLDMLRRHDVAAVVTNSPGWPVIDTVTSDFVYVRLHGDVGHYPDGYDAAAIDEWAGRIAQWLQGADAEGAGGRDVFVYFDNPDHLGIRSPFDAIELQRRIGGPPRGPGVSLQQPLWDD